MFRIGALSLPSVFARLGWLVGDLVQHCWQQACPGRLQSNPLGFRSVLIPAGSADPVLLPATPFRQVSFVLLLLFGLGCGYLGVLFSKLAVALPGAATMDEIGAAALGTTGRRLVYAVVYTTILVDPIALHITCMLALQQARALGEVLTGRLSGGISGPAGHGLAAEGKHGR